MKCEFLARNVACYVEDDVCVVGFADSSNAEPQDYLILSRTLFDAEEDDREIGIEHAGGSDTVTTDVIMSARLDSTSFAMEIASALADVSAFQVSIDCTPNGDLEKHLRIIFEASASKLLVA